MTWDFLCPAIGASIWFFDHTLNMTMLPDNEVVIKYIEEYFHGVIPEDYREARGRILK